MERKVGDLKELDLDGNFLYWTREYQSETKAIVSQEDVESLRCLPTTHTFGWRSGSTTELHREILFKDRSLRSSSSRRGNQKDTSFVASTASEIGFDSYVFTYLGVHDPFYARNHFPAFGVFVRSDRETFPKCIATRRDLASKDIAFPLLWRQFLKPLDSRQLLVTELQWGHCDGSFERYWGYPAHWNVDHWQEVYEFHFRENIPVSDFAAILWPREFMLDPYDGGLVPQPHTADQKEFLSNFPNCKVIFYDPQPHGDPLKAFVKASAEAVEYYRINKRFPEFLS